VAEINDAETIALRVGEHHEIGIVGIAVPIDQLRPDADEASDLRCLLRRRGDVQVQVQTRVVLRRRAAALQGDPGGSAVEWRNEYDRPSAEAIGAHLIAERLAPEGGRSVHVVHA
jgi:hypothetical protein